MSLTAIKWSCIQLEGMCRTIKDKCEISSRGWPREEPCSVPRRAADCTAWQTQSLLIFFTISVKEGVGSSDQVTLRQVLKGRSVPICSPIHFYPNKLLIKDYNHGGFVYPLSSDSLGNSSFIPCGPLGAVTHGGDIAHRWDPSLGCPFRKPPSFRFPVCASSIKNDPSKGNGGLAKA